MKRLCAYYRADLILVDVILVDLMMPALEQACLNDGASDGAQQDLADRLAEVERCLTLVLEGLSVLGEPTSSADSSSASPGSEWHAQLAHARSLLAESDTQALTALLKLQGLASDPRMTEQLNRVVRQAECFDFDQALELLENLS